MKNVEVKSFTRYVVNYKIPIIAIYKRPDDFKDKYIARLYNGNRETKYIIVKDKLEDIRIPDWLEKIKPTSSDVDSLICTYM